MGSRLGGMKGGGFLNNVDGTLVDYEFTDAFPGGAADPENPEIFAVLTVRADGSDAPVQTTLRGGSGAYLAIQDQHTVVNPEGGAARIWDKADLYHFLESVEKAGVADGGIDESGVDVLSFTSLIGRRFRFIQEPDEARMAARAKAGLEPLRVVKGDDGVEKKYPFTRLIVETVYDGETVAQAAPRAAAKPVGRGQTTAARTMGERMSEAAKAVRGAGKAATTPFAQGGKPNGAAASATPSGDLDIETTTKLHAILKANGGEVLRSDVTRLATTMLLAEKNPRRERIRKRMYEPEYLGNIEGIVFDKVAQTISLS